jgi:CBS domain-containing protein
MGLTYDRHHHRAILVLDAGGEVVGKLTHLSILAKLEPSLLQNADVHALDRAGLTPEFIESMEESYRLVNTSLNKLIARAAQLNVEDAMVFSMESIDEQAPLVEAIHMAVKAHVQSLLVTSGGKVTGILRTADVFEEIADVIRASS